MRRTAQYLIALMGICVQMRSLGAQQLRGTVRDSTAATPLPGAVVLIVDSSGGTAARTITDGQGRFALSLAQRSARVRVIRIGYRPSDVALPAGPNPSLDVTMARLPAVLDAVRVSGEELCPGSVDRGPAFQLWEQAPAGLLAAVVAREAKPSMTTSLLFKRQVSHGEEIVTHQETRVGTGRTTRPFIAAASSAEFAAMGYMREDASGGGRTFFAPDADVLLDESFATSHCFHLQPSDVAHPDQVGLAFMPARNREIVVDVRGVIWMDRATPALRSLDFRYTELEPVTVAEGAGGRIEFREVQNGVSFIERWALRMPIATPIRAATTYARPGMSTRLRRQDRVDLRVAAIDETGGMVLGAKWADGTSWQMTPTGVGGDVTQSGSGAPSPYAIVTLAGTADTVTADQHGAFTRTPVLPGRYVLSVSDTALLSYARPRSAAREIEILRDRVTRVRLEVAPILAVLSNLCAGQRIRPSTTTIVGRVVFPNDVPVRNATVHATWQADYNSGAPVREGGGPVTITLAEQTSDVDEHGRFIVCGAAIKRPIRLHFAQGARYADTTVMAREGALMSIEWHPGVSTSVPDDGRAGSPASLLWNREKQR